MKKLNISVWVMVIFSISIHNLSAQQKVIYTLDRCIEIALKNNSQLKNAAKDVKIAGADVLAATSSLLPSLNLNLSSERYIQGERKDKQDVPVDYDPVTKTYIFEQQDIIQRKVERNSHSFSMVLQQNIWDWGRSWNSIQQARIGKENAQYTLLSQKNSVIYNVQMNYYELLKAIKLGDVYQEAVNRSEEQLKRTESMYELGSVALVDVYKAKVTLGNDQIYLINQKNKIIEARANLNNALGLDPNSPIEIEMLDPGDPPMTLTAENVFQVAAQKNPGLKSYEANIKNYKYAKRKAMVAFLPTINGYAQYSRYNELLNRVYNQNFDRDYVMRVGADVDLNIFNGFADKAELQRQSLNYSKAQEDFVEQKRLLKAAVQQALLNLKAYKEISEINADNLKSAEEDLRLAQERYTIGAGTLLELIDSQLAVTRARATLVSAKYDTQVAASYLYSLMGTLNEQ